MIIMRTVYTYYTQYTIYTLSITYQYAYKYIQRLVANTCSRFQFCSNYAYGEFLTMTTTTK